MEQLTIGIVGAGQMGTVIGKAARASGNKVTFFDIDMDKSKDGAKKCEAGFAITINEILACNIIFLAIPSHGVLDFFRKYHHQVPQSSLCINISTFVTLAEIKPLVQDSSNIVSCKIIGHFEKISESSKCVFVVDSGSCFHQLIPMVSIIFDRIGHVIHDAEEKYLQVNYLAAKEAMRSSLNLALELTEAGFGEYVVNAAIKSVLAGTIEQFPYANPDYFHNLVFEQNHDLKIKHEKLAIK